MESASRESRRTLFFPLIEMINMKKFTLIILAVVSICLISSCHKKPQTREEQIEEFRSELTATDTVTMLKLADEAMEQLKAKKIEQVLSSLYSYDDSTKEVTPFTSEQVKRYTSRFKMYPVLDYHRVYYTFMLEGCNDVKYEVVFATAEQTGTGKPATTMFMFNPVKIDGEWKLCLKTAQDQFSKEDQ